MAFCQNLDTRSQRHKKRPKRACLISIRVNTTTGYRIVKLGHHKPIAAVDCNFVMETRRQIVASARRPDLLFRA
jgi:hypothetical protein